MYKFLLFIILSSISFSFFAQEEKDSLNINQPYLELKDGLTHTVAKGETLFAISRKYRVSIRDIKKYNNIGDNSIYVNQVLYINPKKEENIIDVNDILLKVSDENNSIELNEAINDNIKEEEISVQDTITLEEDIDIVIPELPKAIWMDDYYEAKKLAKKEDKVLLLFFTGSDWCGICRMLKINFFESAEFIEIANNDLILYEADFPRHTNYLSKEKEEINWKIKADYHAHEGFPTVILIAPNGKELGRRFNFGIDADTDYHFELVNNAIQQNKK